MDRVIQACPTFSNFFRLIPFPFSYELSFWADILLLCGAAFAWARGVGLSRGAAWVSGFGAAFTGYIATLFCAGHRGVVDAVAVTALAFAVLQCAILRRQFRWFALLGLLLPWGLAAQADIWFILMIGMMAYALFLIVGQCRTEGLRKVMRRLVPGALVTLLCFGIMGFPALRHTFGAAQETRATQLRQAVAATPSPTAEAAAAWQFSTDWSLPPEDCVEFFCPGIKGYTSYRFDPKPYTGRMGSAHQVLRQHSITFGIWTLLLAFGALAARRLRGSLRSERWFWVALAAITLLLSFGRFTPIYRLIWELPFIHQIRAPIKWLHLTGFAVVLLAGIGAEALIRRFYCTPNAASSTAPSQATSSESPCGRTLALLLCLLIAASGVMQIRPYVFPIELPSSADFARLPPHTPVAAAPNYHTFLRANGLRPTQHLSEAAAFLTLRPTTHGFKLILISPQKRK